MPNTQHVFYYNQTLTLQLDGSQLCIVLQSLDLISNHAHELFMVSLIHIELKI